MTKTADEIIASLPEWMKRNYEANFRHPTAQHPAPITDTRGGALALAAMELAEQAEPTPAPDAPQGYTGRIHPGIFCDRNDELSIWRNGQSVAIQLKCRSGAIYYGAPVPALNAEGGFDLVHADEADRAFVRQTIREVVDDAKRASLTPDGATGPRLSRDDFNYRHFATALWSNPNRTGAAVHRAFLVFTWGQAGGSWYPTDAILFDGDKLKMFKLSRAEAKNVRAPQWSGVAK